MAKTPARIRATSRLLALEPRLLFDGAAGIAVEQAAHDSFTDSDAADGHPTTGHDAALDAGDVAGPAPTLVFIDSRVSGYADLAADLQAQGADVQVIEQHASGLQAVGDALAQAGNVGQLQIIGLQDSDGGLQLGSDHLSAAGPALAAQQGWDYYLAQDAVVEVQGLQAQDDALPAAFSRMLLAAVVPAEGAISEVRNTSDDGTVTVGENDTGSAVAKDWEVKGSGSISVTVSGGATGTLSHASGSLTFTGTASEVNTWLDGVRYAYTGSSQVGDSDSFTLGFTTYAQDGSATSSQKSQAISIAPQNDAPTVGSNGQTIGTVAEGGSLNFGAPVASGSGFAHALLGITDLDNIPEQVIIKLDTIPDPTHGSLVLNLGGRLVTLAVGSTLSVADLQNLSYVHTGKQVSPANGEAATPLQAFRFTIDDGAGGRLTAQEVSIRLTPVNQAPAVSGSVTIIEGEKNVSLGAGGNLPVIAGERGQIAGTDPDDSQLSYTITALPTIGTLSYEGVLLTNANIAGTVISDLSKLTYSYPDGSEPTTHGGKVNFTIQVKDSGGGAGAGAARAVSSVVSLTILDNNDDPVLSTNVQQDYVQLRGDRLVTNNSFTITADMLAVTDPDSFDNHLVFNIKRADTEGGYFTLNGKLLVAGTSFSMQDIREGKVAYHLRASSAQERIDSFTFTVTDSATGVLFYGDNQAAQRDGGIYDSALPGATLKQFSFGVKVPISQPGNDGVLPGLPDVAAGFTIGGSKTFTLLESAGSSAGSNGYVLSQANLNTTDGVNPPDKITYRLEQLPASGTLYLSGRALNQFDSFTQADINAGKLVFAHAGGEQFSDLFRFSVSNGSIATDALGTVEISITAQNDTPTAAQRDTVTLLEGKSVVINGSGLGHIVLADSDTAVAGAGGYANQNLLKFEITGLPATGKLYLVDAGGGRNELGAGAVVTQAELDAGKLIYVHNGAEVFADSFTITPIDNQNVGGGVGTTPPTSTNQASRGADVVIKITIAPENDAPELASKSHLTNGNALFEGNSATIYGTTVPAGTQAPYGQLAYTDPDNSKLQTQFRVTEATQYGQLFKGSVALKVGSVFTQADLDAGLITYQHNGGEGHTDSFKYLVSDGDFTVNDTGVSQTGSVFNIQVKPSNDTPVFSSKPGAPILVDGTNAVNNPAPGFQLSDPDLAVLNDGETDRITVIVRVTDADGNPVAWNTAGLGNVVLRVDHVTGVSGITLNTNGALQLSGSQENINATLKTLSVGFSSDLNAKYQLQVIADDRLNAAGTAYQNGGAGVKANGGERNHVSAGNTTVDATTYDWNSVATSSLQGSHNLAIATAELWVSTVNNNASLTVPTSNYVAQEDVPFKLGGISVGDQESERFGTHVTLTLQVGSGTLSALGLPPGITANGGTPGTLVLTGSVAALNGFLSSAAAGEGVFYTSALDVNHDTNGAAAGDATLTVTLKEGAANHEAPAEGGSAIGGDVGNGSVENAAIVKTVAIVIDAINDAPAVTAPTGNVSVNSSGWVEVGKFTLGDADSANGYAAGETDGSIEVTVRLLDNSGNPLAAQRYTDLGIQLGSSSASNGVGLDASLDGVSGALQLRGKLADIQAYLDGLQVRFTNTTAANVDATYRVEVIVDDRLRDAGGSLIANQANGGMLNQNGTNAPQAISAKDDFDVYGGKVADFKDGGTKVYNVVSAYRSIFVSSVNDPAQIGISGVYAADSATLQATETSGRNYVTLENLTIRDSDAQGAVVEVKLRLPEGFSFSAASSRGVIGDAGRLLTLTGTLAQINAAFKDVQIRLPDVAGDAQAEDWNGSFSFEVAVDDRGNTGITPDLAPADSNGNRYSFGDYNGNRTLIATRDIGFVVNPVNDAPVVKPVDGKTQATLPSVAEDHTQTAAPTGTGSTVGSLFGGYFDDSRDAIDGQQPAGGTGGTQADSFHGVAITANAATAAQGKWQYYSGTAWVDIPTNLSIANALVLSKDVALQFIPAADWHGTPGTLSARLIEANVNGDTTSTASVPASGARINLTNATGNTSRYSTGAVTLGITVTPVNDAPLATPDTHSMSENDASVSGGLIKQPAGSNKGSTGVDSDKDSALDASEAIVVTAVRNSDGVSGSVAGNGAISVDGKYGSLVVQPDGSYSYQLRTNDPDVNKLVAGQKLTESFGYTITDTGNLSASSTLTITINGDDDGGASIVATDHNASAAGQITVKESGLAQGSNPGSDATASGTLRFTAGNGLETITIGGRTFTLAQLEAIVATDSSTHASIDIAGYGALVITGLRADAGYAVPVAGNIDYRFTLTQPQAHANANGNNSVTPGVALSITDAGGKVHTGTLNVNIVDDTPTAVADTGSVTEGATLTVDAAHGVLSNDKSGADGWKSGGAVTGVVAGAGTPLAGGVGTALTGQYGTLTLDANGSYSYVARPDATAADAQDVFTYTVTDADGDTSTTTLTIEVANVTGTPTSTTGVSVAESGLSNGSTPGIGHVTSGDLTLAAGWSVGTAQGGSTALGNWSVGTDGRFSYTLKAATTDVAGADETDSFSYTSVDQYGNTVTNTVAVNIVDDVPTATADSGSVTEGATLSVDAAHGVLSNDKSGADGWKSGGAVTGVIAGAGTPVAHGVGTALTGQYGTLTLNADGSYSYVARPDATTADAQDVFSYTVTDADGDTSTTTLTINVADVTGTPAATTGASVHEGGLSAGSTPGTGHTAGGSLTLTSGWNVETAQSGTTAFGRWSVATDGSYSYTLTQPTTDLPGAAETDSFSYTVTDAYGNTATNTVAVTIVDDVPTAVADTGDVTEGRTLTVPAASGVLSNDKSGADGWKAAGAVTGVIAGAGTPVASGVGAAVTGQYGTLTLNADGSYSYVARPDAITANARDVFSYTVTDADGDTSTTTLTIDVADVTGTPAATTGASVQESGLPAGTTPGTGHTASGELTLNPGWSVGSAQSGNAGFGSWSVGTDGSYSYTLTKPTTDLPGAAETDSFSYTVTDAYGNTATNTVTVAIVDDMPTAMADTGSVTEGRTLTVPAASGVLANDKSGADGWKSSGAVTGVIAGAGMPVASGVGAAITGHYGTLTLNADGSYGYVARPDAITANARDIFSYTVTDADGDTSTTTLTIEVADVTGMPATTSGASVAESGLPAGSAPGQGHGTSGDLNLASGWSVGTAQSGSTALGNWSVTTDGRFSYTLTHATTDVAGAEETDSFSYTSVDAYGNTVTNSVVVNIVDDMPTARDDRFTTAEDATLTGDLKLDHSQGEDLPSADGNTWTLVGGTADGAGNTLLTTARGGSVTLHADGTFSYVPVADWHGSDSFAYAITDGDGDVSTATVTITVTPVADIAPDTTSTHAGHPVTTEVLTNDSFEGRHPVVSVEDGDGPGHGTVSVNPDGSITYSPTAGYVGQDRYTYTVTSGGTTESTTVTIDVTNEAPRLPLLVEVVSTPEDTPVSGNLLDGASDADGDTLTVTQIRIANTVHGVPAGGAVTVEIPGKGSVTVASDGSYTFTPEADWHGSVPVIGYTVSDGNSNGNVDSTLTLAVTPVADIAPDTATTHSGQPVTTTVLGNDSFEGRNPVVTVEAGNGPAHGSVSVNGDGTVTYTPDAGYVGQDRYTYTVTSGGVTESATVTIDVTNIAPEVQPEVVSTPEDTPVSGKLLDNDSDAEGDPLTVTEIRIEGSTHGVPAGGSVRVEIPGKGSISVGSDGSYTFTPEADWNGSVPVIGYTVSDGNSNGNVDSTLTLTVTPVVDITPDTATTHAGTPVTTAVLGNDSFEGRNPVVTVEPGNGPAHGSVSVNADGSITYQPVPGYVGEDRYTYTVTSGGVTESTTVTVAVTNTPPVAHDDRHVTAPGMPAQGNVLTGGSAGDVPDSDPNGDTLVVTQIGVDGQTHAIPPGQTISVRVDGKGTLEFASDGSYTFTPDVFWGGEVPAIGYTISDGNTGTATATLQITATAAPQAPQVTPATPGEIPTDAQQPERPLFDPAGSTRWKGDAAREPSVFWENQSHDQIMRLPLAVHPITYVNRQVQSEQAERQFEAALGTDPALLGNGEVRSGSIGSGLGQDQQIYVQHSVRGAQGEGQFWQLKAWRNAPNLPVQTPADALELDVPVLPADAAPPAAAAGDASTTPPEVASAEDALLQRWAQAAAGDVPDPSGAVPPAAKAVAADSFSARIRAQANALPSHLS